MSMMCEKLRKFFPRPSPIVSQFLSFQKQSQKNIKKLRCSRCFPAFSLICVASYEPRWSVVVALQPHHPPWLAWPQLGRRKHTLTHAIQCMDYLPTWMVKMAQIQWEMYVNIPLHGSYGLNSLKTLKNPQTSHWKNRCGCFSSQPKLPFLGLQYFWPLKKASTIRICRLLIRVTSSILHFANLWQPIYLLHQHEMCPIHPKSWVADSILR